MNNIVHDDVVRPFPKVPKHGGGGPGGEEAMLEKRVEKLGKVRISRSFLPKLTR